MTMKYKTKCICRIDPNYRETTLKVEFLGRETYRPCIYCNDTGEVEYHLGVDFSRTEDTSSVVFWSKISEDAVEAKIDYEDFSMRLVCSCGDEVSLNEGGDARVCSCGRVYCLWVEVLKDDTHRGDMEYWEKIKKEKAK